MFIPVLSFFVRIVLLVGSSFWSPGFEQVTDQIIDLFATQFIFIIIRHERVAAIFHSYDFFFGICVKASIFCLQNQRKVILITNQASESMLILCDYRYRFGPSIHGPVGIQNR